MNRTVPQEKLALQPDELEIVRDILSRHLPDREVWAFGSRVKGKARRYSDLDLAVLGEHPLALAARAELAEDFAESDLPFKVDIVDWAIASERFREIIRAEYVEIPLDRTREQAETPESPIPAQPREGHTQ